MKSSLEHFKIKLCEMQKLKLFKNGKNLAGIVFVQKAAPIGENSMSGSVVEIGVRAASIAIAKFMPSLSSSRW